MRTAALVLIAAAWPRAEASAGAGDARDLNSAEHHFQLALPQGWEPVTPAPGPEKVVASYANRATSQVLALTRVDFPNADAWRKKKEYFAAVEAGFAQASKGYRRQRVRRRRLGRVPAMDLWFQRQTDEGSERVMVRLLFFRTFSLSLAVAGPADAPRRATDEARRIATGFRPYFGE